jgi:hypothetical protein
MVKTRLTSLSDLIDGMVSDCSISKSNTTSVSINKAHIIYFLKIKQHKVRPGFFKNINMYNPKSAQLDTI